jgi:hypothetical protein
MRKLAFATLLLLGACKQGVGEICQVDSDCASNKCSMMQSQDDMPVVNHCLPESGAVVPDGAPIDSGPPPDSAPPDAVPLDAAPPDATL